MILLEIGIYVDYILQEYISQHGILSIIRIHIKVQIMILCNHKCRSGAFIQQVHA